MIYFIHPIDESTKFLKLIYTNVINRVGKENVTVFSFENYDDEDIYKDEISKLPENSFVCFLGHGRADKFYGVLEDSNEAYISSGEMTLFNNKNLLALACKSDELLKNTFRYTEIKHAIGFGYLPTSYDEVHKIKNMRNKSITGNDIENFKGVIVSCISESLIETYSKNQSFEYLNSYLRMLLFREVNNCVLERGDTALANLIYQMLFQMRYQINSSLGR